MFNFAITHGSRNFLTCENHPIYVMLLGICIIAVYLSCRQTNLQQPFQHSICVRLSGEVQFHIVLIYHHVLLLLTLYIYSSFVNIVHVLRILK